MIEKKITIADIDDESLRSLYQTAFPEEEQIPWQDLMRLVEEMPLDFTAYYEDKQFIGLTIVLPIKSSISTELVLVFRCTRRLERKRIWPANSESVD